MSIWMVLKNQNMIMFLWMDADGSMPAKSVKDMVKILMENQDSVIIGSRFVDGGAYKGILELEEKSLIKAVLNVYKSNDTVLGMIFSNLFNNKLLRFIFKSKVFDITSGFIVGNKSNFSINSFKRHSYGEYFIDVVGNLLNSNVNIIEHGYVCETRKYGKSKLQILLQLLKRGYPYIVTAIKVRKMEIKDKREITCNGC